MKFHVYIDRNFSDLATVLLESIRSFSSHEIVVTAFNFDFRFDCDRVAIKRINTPSTFENDRMLRPRLIAQIGEPGIIIDADTVVNWNVDELFELCESDHTILQCQAPCGYGAEKPIEALGLPNPVPHYNCVPMILTKRSQKWLQNGLEHIDELTRVFRSVYGANYFTDDLIFDWLRYLTQETCYLNSCCPDRLLFPLYLGSTSEVMKATGPYSPLYHDRHVSWHMFHGEKDAAKARWMYQELLSRGPEFIKSSPARSRRPRITDVAHT